MVFHNLLLHSVKSFNEKQKNQDILKNKFLLILKMMTSRFVERVGRFATLNFLQFWHTRISLKQKNCF